MHIEEVRLRGFKSFADSSDLSLSNGITVVVGPNGAGKSNVVDGLRWIGGESSAKRVRGGELEDLIFSGTGERMPLGAMEVGILISGVGVDKLGVFGDDIDKEGNSVDLRRRLERGKGSSYSVNGKEVLKRDVDIFLGDIAFGGGSLSIVGQGVVGDIVNMDGARRRRILEATSGLQGLRERYLDAGMRLQGVETNLEKLEEYEVIFNQQIAQLEEQAKKVRRYKAYAVQIRSIALYSITRGVEEVEEQFGQLRIKESEQVAEELRIVREIADFERSFEVLRDRMRGLRSVKEDRFSEEREVRFALRSLEMKEEQIRTEKSSREEEKNRLDNDVLKEEQEIGQAEKSVKEVQQELKNWESRCIDQEDLRKKEECLQVLNSDFRDCERAYDVSYRELTVLETEKEKRQGMVLFSKERVQESKEICGRAKQAYDVSMEAAWGDMDSSDILSDRDSMREKLKEIEDEVEFIIEERDQLKERVEEMQRSFEEQEKRRQAELRDLQEQKINVEVESKTLQRVIFDEVQAEDSILKDVDVKKGYEGAVDALWGKRLLSGAMNANQTGEGWRDDWLDDGDLSAMEVDDTLSLSAFVSVPDIVKRSLLSVGVVDSVEHGFILQKRLKKGEVLVTKEGSIWYWDGYVKIVSDDSKGTDNLLSLKKRREELLSSADALLLTEEAFLESMETAKQAFEAQVKNLREDIKTKELQISESTQNLDDLALDIGEIEVTLQTMVREHERAKWEETQKAEAYSQAKLNLEREQKVQENHESMYQALPDFGDKEYHVEVLKVRRQEMALVCESESRLFREMERESAMVNEKLTLLLRDLSEWERRKSQANGRLESLRDRQTSLEKSHGGMVYDPEELSREKQKLLSEIDRKVGLCNDAEQVLLKAEKEETEQREHLREQERSLLKVRESLAESRAEKKMLEEDKRRLDILKAEKEREHEAFGLEADKEQAKNWQKSWQNKTYEQLQEDQKRLEHLRDRMGAVNLLSEEELIAKRKEQEERLLQIEDVREASKMLKRSRRELEGEAVDRFLVIFEKINVFFDENFRHVFGGGSARLVLGDPNDALHSEVEVEVNLPGKRVKHLTLLSGGEQTLVALCLLFAMFRTYPAPLYVLDEVDAALDDVNVGNFCDLLEQHAASGGMRFLVISHHRHTMASADRLFGVTMVEKGVSKLVSVDLVDALERWTEKKNNNK